MKLTEIVFVNFRQFYGQQTYTFSTQKDAAVDLIFGSNGSGKTTFLNAFHWAFYGTFTTDVEQQETLINHSRWQEARPGEELEASVTVRFSHGEVNYKVIRSAKGTKDGTSARQTLSSPELRVEKAESVGIFKVLSDPQREINTILPPNLSQFFFFNGERMENLSKNRTYESVKDEIRGLLDLRQVERAQKDSLPEVLKLLRNEFSKQDNGRASQIEEELDQQEANLEASIEQLGHYRMSIAQNKNEIREIQAEQKKQTEVAPLVKDRDRWSEQAQQTKAEIERLRSSLDDDLFGDGFFAFTDALTTQCSGQIRMLKENGLLPEPLSKEFLDSLIEKEECVCGTPLELGSKARRLVDEAQSKSYSTEDTYLWTRLEGALPGIVSARNKLQREVREKRLTISEAEGKWENAQRSQAEASEKLQQINAGDEKNYFIDVGELETRRVELERSNVRLEYKVDQEIKSQSELDKTIASLKLERKSAQSEGLAAERTLRRIELVEEVRDALAAIYKIREEKLLEFLNRELKRNYQKISYQDHTPHLSDDFEVRLFSGDDRAKIDVAKSTGENQVLNLCFLAAVSRAAQERIENSGSTNVLSGEKAFPIVMDAAFGSLDEGYQRRVTELLGSIASQLIILVSKSQGLGVVSASLDKYVGGKGVIVAHSSAEHVQEEDIKMNGRLMPYIVKDSKSYSEIKSVKGF